VRLRPSGPREFEILSGVHEASASLAFAHIFGAEPFPLEHTQERWRTFPGRVVVAEEAGVVVGFAAFDDRQLHALYVLPERQGRGIGDRLLAAAGPVEVLWVLDANARGRRFYERRGWRPDGGERVAFGVRELRYRAAPRGGRRDGRRAGQPSSAPSATRFR
jgi:GNAT superfamily N-acetyltransferase